MRTVTITRGLPGSGKTTAAVELVRAADGRLRRVNMDDLRRMLDDNHGSRFLGGTQEAVVKTVQDAAIVAAVDAGFDVIVDNTHMTPHMPRRYKRLLATRDVRFECLDLSHVPVKECIRRDAERPRPVGEDVILKMYNRMAPWSVDELNDRPAVEPYTPPKMSDVASARRAVLCDIDGTLAIHNGRGPYDFARVETDLVNEEVRRVLRLCHEEGDWIILLSGRQSEFREHTERWLKANRVRYNELRMRAEGDRRGDDIVKAELFDAHVRHRFDVRFVLDDRDRVVALWRRIGLRCWQVDYGDF